MSIRLPSLLTLTLLLGACASEPPPPPRPAPPSAPIEAPQASPTEAPIPADFHVLTGTLEGVPAGTQVELAMLQIDEAERPQRLLGTLKLEGSGRALPFRLAFNPEKFPPNARVELHGRITRDGMLIARIAPRRLAGPATQELGTLNVIAVP